MCFLFMLLFCSLPPMFSGRNERRQALQRAIIDAQVVCCTAVTAGGGLLKEIPFPLVPGIQRNAS